MPRGDCEREFQQAAAEAGVVLVSRRHDWLTQRGHLALPPAALQAQRLLRRIFIALGGDEVLLASARGTTLPNDHFHESTGCLVEVDELQHFTSARLLTLSLYPPELALGFDLRDYQALCQKHHGKADGMFAHRQTKCFGPRGRQRQRAYNDALRDIGAPALGHPGVIRAPALDRNGRTAWDAVRDRLPARPARPHSRATRAEEDLQV